MNNTMKYSLNNITPLCVHHLLRRGRGERCERLFKSRRDGMCITPYAAKRNAGNKASHPFSRGATTLFQGEDYIPRERQAGAFIRRLRFASPTVMQLSSLRDLNNEQ
jgi:hypothetical protein